MKPIQSFIVTANLPKSIEKLGKLAYNYWWCWNFEAKELFIRIDRSLWEEVNHNPVLLINKIPQEKLDELSTKADFIRYLDYVYDKYKRYMNAKLWFDSIENKPDGTIAYFSPEFGINESFPNYSGGLGVLAGDHLKSASDLGLPLVAIGLLYQQGYFRQHLAMNGWQNEYYHYNDFFSLPLKLVTRNGGGEPIIIDVDLPAGKAFAQIWKLQVGRVALFLLDTNIELNNVREYREISDQLYGGGRDTRIRQEIMLGIGGMRALNAMGISPAAVHINEGHAAFALLERTRQFMEQFDLDFKAASQITIASSTFTTHTPVPAGNEAFKLNLLGEYFAKYYPSLGLSHDEFVEMGQQSDYNADTDFSMTVLGLKLTAYHNGVSKLHGKVSRNMWHKIWQCFPVDEVPIKAITNGVHTQTWVAREFAILFNRYLSPGWKTETDNEKIWQDINQIPSEEIWREKQRRRVRLVLFARRYLKDRQKGYLPPDQMRKIEEHLDPDALTIGFARRFATYKRATLLFRDMERLAGILRNPDKPVQIIISGKAHPHDTAGKETIQSIIQKVREYNLEHYVVFLEDYDMVIARLMIKGCDVWLNNPIRPYEASGTSGMKAAINGTLNLSILDGWWDEAFNGKNGFAIGEGDEYDNHEEQDIIESDQLYDLLEHVVVNMYYDRDGQRFPEKWVSYMKESIKSIAPEFSTTRMVKDYTNKCYLKALKRFAAMTADGKRIPEEFKLWKDKIIHEWKNVEVIDTTVDKNNGAYVGKKIYITSVVNLAGLTPEDVDVQVVYGGVDHHDEFKSPKYESLQLVKSEGKYHHYKGYYKCPDTGMQGLTVRIMPKHELLDGPGEMYICSWA